MNKPDDKQIVKPPIGVIPYEIWLERRCVDLWNAIQRYKEANLDYPPDWLTELSVSLPRLYVMMNKKTFKEMGYDLILKYIFQNG